MAKKFLDYDGLIHLWDKIKTILGNKSDIGHTHTSTEISGLSDVTKNSHTHSNKSVLDVITTDKIFKWDYQTTYLNTHPENSPTIIPFIYNDLAFLTKKGGSLKTYSTTSTDFTVAALTEGTISLGSPENLFDGSPSYSMLTTTGEYTAVFDLTLHKTFPYSNMFYIDFGAVGWRANNIAVYVMNTDTETVYTKKASVTDNTRGQWFCNISHSSINSDGATVQGFNKLRVVISSFNNTSSTSGKRISQIGLINYGSYGVTETFISRGGCSGIYGSLIPNSTNAIDLGNSSKYWRNIYAQNLYKGGKALATEEFVTEKGYITSPDGGNADTVDGYHADVLAKTNTANTFDGEQKYVNSSYAPTVTDSASGVGCAFKASRGLYNEALLDKIIMTSSTGKIPFYKYTGTDSGQMTGLVEVSNIDSNGKYNGDVDTVDGYHASAFAMSSHTHSYNSLTNMPIISKTGYSGSADYKTPYYRYFYVGHMAIDDGSNYGNYTFTGRMGGYEDTVMATYQINLMNRSNARDGNTIFSTVSAYGNVAEALKKCDMIVLKNDDNSHDVYLKVYGWYAFNFNWETWQHSVGYTGEMLESIDESKVLWRLSTAPKTILDKSGKFSASGGIAGLEKVATSGNFYDLVVKPEILTRATNGFNGAICAGSDGVAEYGRYCDFHLTKETTSDYSTRLTCTGDYKNNVNLPSGEGTLVIGDKAYKIVTSSSAPTENDTSVITLVV